MKLLWEEWRIVHSDGMSYPTWCERFQTQHPERAAAMRKIRHPGERLFVDYASMTVAVMIEGVSREVQAGRRRTCGGDRGQVGVPVITLRRWRQRLRETIPQTRLWRWKRGELAMAMAPGEAPLWCVLRRIWNAACARNCCTP